MTKHRKNNIKTSIVEDVINGKDYSLIKFNILDIVDDYPWEAHLYIYSSVFSSNHDLILSTVNYERVLRSVPDGYKNTVKLVDFAFEVLTTMLDYMDDNGDITEKNFGKVLNKYVHGYDAYSKSHRM